MRTKLFVSRSLDNQSVLIDFCKSKDWELIDRSLIYFEDVPFEVKKPFDIVFISSIRSFEFFLEGFRGDPHELEYAIVGEATAKQMNVEISQIKYIVENSGDTTISPLEFKDWLGNRKVLFPVSQISNNTYSGLVEDARKEVVVCYNTLAYPSEIEECEIYVFTSPSNVSSFLQTNHFPENAQIIAWGNTTEAYLLKRNLKPVFVLKESTEKELVDFLHAYSEIKS